MLDALLDISDADLAAIHAQQLLPRPQMDAPIKNLTHELFRYDLYDWSRWDELATGYQPLKLSKGYFTFVDERRLPKLQRTFSYFYANVQKRRDSDEIVKIYAVCGGNGRGETYLHRFITGVTDRNIVVDHRTGLSLDNRDAAIKRTLQFRNLANHDSSGRRSTHEGLKRGVYPLESGLFKAQIKHDGVTFRSEEAYETEDEAHAWYCRMFRKIFKFDFIDLSQKPNFPIFPPLKGEKEYIPF